MAVSLNSVVGFTSTELRVKYQNVSKSCSGASLSKACQVKSNLGALGPRRLVKGRRCNFSPSVAEGDRFTTETSDGASGNAERLLSNDQISTTNLPSSLDSAENSQVQTSSHNESVPQTSEAFNGSPVSLNQGETSPSSNLDRPKRSPLTARERLRAARVLSRYNTDSKASKPDMGSNVLDAIRESDRGKKKGLPEAPGNMLDDSKRGLPQQGFTFQFPGGNDLFFIVFSFVFISTVMFATTYIVWKVGAIHFNEY